MGGSPVSSLKSTIWSCPSIRCQVLFLLKLWGTGTGMASGGGGWGVKFLTADYWLIGNNLTLFQYWLVEIKSEIINFRGENVQGSKKRAFMYKPSICPWYCQKCFEFFSVVSSYLFTPIPLPILIIGSTVNHVFRLFPYSSNSFIIIIFMSNQNITITNIQHFILAEIVKCGTM